MFVYGSDANNIKVVTPALSGSLLPGITRESLLQVAEDMGYATEQVRISVDDWKNDVADGKLTESLACGTAAVITPVGHVVGNDIDFTVNGNEAGEVTMALRERLTQIQRGEFKDTHGWLHTLVPAN